MKNKKRKISIVLFGISFLIAILGEAYLLNLPKPDTFSVIGIGIVVILTGYLWFDSIWEHISHRIKEIQTIREKNQQTEAEKWDLRYTELLNIQKATYSALKKSIINIQKELDQISQLQNKLYAEQKAIQNMINNNIEDDMNQKKAEPEIIPLYDDPNAALSEDEIATLFNTYGKK